MLLEDSVRLSESLLEPLFPSALLREVRMVGIGVIFGGGAVRDGENSGVGESANTSGTESSRVMGTMLFALLDAGPDGLGAVFEVEGLGGAE